MKAEDFDKGITGMIEAGAANMFKAESIEELAEKTGIDLNGLQKTINEYNQACETGRDDVFNKRVCFLRPVKTPPFYASKNVVNAPAESEGIKVNHNTEVIGEDYRVIPGLYAAGMEIAADLYNGTYAFVLPGNAMGFALNSGRIAAENAVKYLNDK